uniref:G-protein coupled receptors family 1 profile domain-containing protein n=1 Tax=Sphaeramia orbicularis TaxID=375764 RepID=A0A672ZMN0_9TELE
MGNSTHLTHFILSAYFDTGHLKYLYFVIVLLLYVLMLVSNVLLIVVICVNRSLHEPMYLFLCSLFVNELYGSTGMFPSLLIHILTDIHTVSTPLCFLQIYCIYSYVIIEYLTLAVIFLYVSVMISVTLSLHLCGNIINKVYCDNYSAVKLACSDTTAVNIYSLSFGFIIISVPSFLILYLYMRILKVCFSGSKQTRHKAVSTCTPHLASLINFSFGCCFEVITSRFNMNHVPNILRVFLSLYFPVCQPLFNPLTYGLNISNIRICCRKLLFAQM